MRRRVGRGSGKERKKEGDKKRRNEREKGEERSRDIKAGRREVRGREGWKQWVEGRRGGG